MKDAAARARAPEDALFVDGGEVRLSAPCPIIASLRDPQSVAGEELRLLRSRLRRANPPGSGRCLAVTSALPSEGKSTLALGLAAAFARDPARRVLLVEADLRRPSISASLGLSAGPGLSDYLSSGLDALPLRRLKPGGFSLVSAGQVSLEEPEALGSPRMDALLRAARTAFDDVVVDVPPVLPVADTVLIQDLVDEIVLVVRSRATSRDAILEALGRLQRGKIVGIILNDHREYRHSYTTYAYDRYGMTHGERRPKGGAPR